MHQDSQGDIESGKRHFGYALDYFGTIRSTLQYSIFQEQDVRSAHTIVVVISSSGAIPQEIQKFARTLPHNPSSHKKRTVGAIMFGTLKFARPYQNFPFEPRVGFLFGPLRHLSKQSSSVSFGFPLDTNRRRTRKRQACVWVDDHQINTTYHELS